MGGHGVGAVGPYVDAAERRALTREPGLLVRRERGHRVAEHRVAPVLHPGRPRVVGLARRSRTGSGRAARSRSPPRPGRRGRPGRAPARRAAPRSSPPPRQAREPSTTHVERPRPRARPRSRYAVAVTQLASAASSRWHRWPTASPGRRSRTATPPPRRTPRPRSVARGHPPLAQQVDRGERGDHAERTVEGAAVEHRVQVRAGQHRAPVRGHRGARRGRAPPGHRLPSPSATSSSPRAAAASRNHARALALGGGPRLAEVAAAGRGPADGGQVAPQGLEVRQDALHGVPRGGPPAPDGAPLRPGPTGRCGRRRPAGRQRGARPERGVQPGLGVPRARPARGRRPVLGGRRRTRRRTTQPDSWLQGMRTAPVVVVPLSCKEAYLDRYAEPDKGWTDRDESRWPVPYWDIDTGMAALLILQTAVDEGLGACFFGVPPDRTEAFREAFGVPAAYSPIGAITVGHRTGTTGSAGSPSRRPRRPADEVVHRGLLVVPRPGGAASAGRRAGRGGSSTRSIPAVGPPRGRCRVHWTSRIRDAQGDQRRGGRARPRCPTASPPVPGHPRTRVVRARERRGRVLIPRRRPRSTVVG